MQSVWTASNSGRRGTPSPPPLTTADSSLVVGSSFFFLDPCSDLGQWIRIIQEALLGIRDILVRIRMRIRILGSVPVTNGSGMPKNIRIRVRMRIRNTVHLHHSSKIKSLKEVTKQYKSRFFLLSFLDDEGIRSLIGIRIREA